MFFLVVMLGLIAFVGLVIDGANAFAEKRHVQNAADAAALAAAQDLKDAIDPACDAACLAAVGTAVADTVSDYSADNGGASPLASCPAGDPSATNCYVWPYNGSNGRIEVRLRNTAEGFFTKVLGLGTSFFKPRGRAVAGVQPDRIWHEPVPPVWHDGVSPAVYVGKPNCTGVASFTMSGGPVLFTGGIFSNGGWDSPAEGFSPGTGASSYGGPNSCSLARAVTDPDIVLTSNSPAGVGWPIGWDPAVRTPDTVPCDFYAPGTGTGKWTFPTTQPVPGVYCARRPDGTSASEIELPSGLICSPNCTFTLVAPQITVQGQNKTYLPYYEHLLFYATGGTQHVSAQEDVITISNQGNSFQGVIYAPKGFFRLSNGGNNGGSSASIVAWGVRLSGGNGLQFSGAYAPTSTYCSPCGTPGYWEFLGAQDPTLDE